MNHYHEPSVDFDYDAIDRGNPLAAELCEASAHDRESDTVTMGKLFSLLLTLGGTDPKQFFITANVVSYALGIHPNQKSSGEIIAAGLHMEKAAWFRRVNNTRRLLKERNAALPKIAGEWTREARKSIAAKTTQIHQQRKQHANDINHDRTNTTLIAIHCRALAAARN